MECYICAIYRAELKTSDGIPICSNCHKTFLPENNLEVCSSSKIKGELRTSQKNEEPALEIKTKVATSGDFEFEWNGEDWLDLELDF